MYYTVYKHDDLNGQEVTYKHIDLRGDKNTYMTVVGDKDVNRQTITLTYAVDKETYR